MIEIAIQPPRVEIDDMVGVEGEEAVHGGRSSRRDWTGAGFLGRRG